MNDIQFTLNGKAVSYAGSAADRRWTCCGTPSAAPP